MRKIKLLGLLSLFVIPVLGNVSFAVTNEYKSNLATSELKNFNKNNFTDPEPEPEHFFRVGENEYDTFADAISGATDGDTIQVLKDFTASDTPETAADLPKVTIDKSLTINGIGDDGVSHQIIGQKMDINGENTVVNFENVIVNGNKKFNKNGDGNSLYLIGCTGSTLNLRGHTVIKNYKFYSHSLIKLNENSTLNIYDETEITDCASKYGLIRFNPMQDCPTVNMYGGKIHHNYSSNFGDKALEGLIFIIFGDNKGGDTNPPKLHIYGGEICYNTADCWSDEEVKYHTVGLIFLFNDLIDIQILGGSIHDNVTKLGGGVMFGRRAPNILPRGNVVVGGDARIYGNHGVDDNGELFDSNIYVDYPNNNQGVAVSEDHPLTDKSKIGVFLSNDSLPTEGNSQTVIYEAEHKDLSHFVADNKAYTMRYEGDDNHTIAIYKYTEDDPRFSEPIFNNDLHYNGKEQQLILTPGEVTTAGGIMKYSQDYEEGMEIEDAHWTDNPSEIVGKDLGDYKVSYYVTASEGFKASEVITQTAHIGKPLMDIIWPKDSFIAGDSVQEVKPTYINAKGETITLSVMITVNGEETDFKDATRSPDSPYVVTVIDPEDQDFDFPKECSKEYIMRISQEEYEKEHMEIETIPGSDKPYVKVESDIGFDEWTKLHAKSVDKSNPEEKKEYEQAESSLSENKNLKGDDSVSAVYDVKMLNQDNIEVQPDGSLKIYFALPNGISVNNNISIYHIHINEDGSKEIIEAKHDYTEDGYASIITDKLSSFVIVHHQKSLLWLIITLSIVGAALIGASTYVIIKEKQKKTKEGTSDE